MSGDPRPTVLVADAHEHYCSGLVRAIGGHPGLRLGAVVDDGCEALSLIMTELPDLALLDVRLGGLDGFAICEQLMSAEPGSRTGVVLMSAVLDQAQLARARAVGAIGPLSKELSRWEICEALLAAARGIGRDPGSRSVVLTRARSAVGGNDSETDGPGG